MQITIKYFGRIAELINQSDEQITLVTASNVRALKSVLETKYPQLQQESYKVAVNQSIAHEDALVEQESEIALLPPFAGG